MVWRTSQFEVNVKLSILESMKCGIQFQDTVKHCGNTKITSSPYYQEVYTFVSYHTSVIISDINYSLNDHKKIIA